MTALAVCSWLASQLDGRDIGTPAALAANIGPLPVDPALTEAGPTVWIWPGREEETVPEMSAGQLRKNVYQPLTLALRQTVPPPYSDFLATVARFKALLRALPQSVHVSDPVTGDNSTLSNVGFQLAADYTPPRVMQALKPQRFVYTCRMGCWERFKVVAS